jgi:hypothetical protein
MRRAARSDAAAREGRKKIRTPREREPNIRGASPPCPPGHDAAPGSSTLAACPRPPSRGSIVNSSTSASGVRPNKGRLLLCSNKTTHTQAKRAQLAKKEHLHSTKRTLVSHPHRLARALAPRPIPAQIRRRNLLRPRRRTGRRDSPSRGSQPRSVLCPTPPPPVWVSRWGWVIPVQEKKLSLQDMYGFDLIYEIEFDVLI